MSEKNTVQVEVTVTLPGALAKEAKAKGLLTPSALETWLRAELQRQRVEQLFEASDRLASLPISPLTDAEINAEIRSARAARRGTRASRG